MTKQVRRQIAYAFRAKLNLGMHRKLALQEIKDHFNVSRRSIYRYCAQFGVPTN